jgi:hypothetical protein
LCAGRPPSRWHWRSLAKWLVHHCQARRDLQATTAEIAENGSDVKLYILNKLPTPYTDEMFRRLAADPEIDLQIYHLWKGSWRRPWKTELQPAIPINT